MCDALKGIKNDKNFVKKVALAIDSLNDSKGKCVNIKTEHFVNTAVVIEEYHSNNISFVLVGGNSG